MYKLFQIEIETSDMNTFLNVILNKKMKLIFIFTFSVQN